MEDGIVRLENRSLEELLQIVRELRQKDVKFEWSYHPPPSIGGPRSAKFVFLEAKWSLWFELRYK